jgi:hypothetical protein
MAYNAKNDAEKWRNLHSEQKKKIRCIFSLDPYTYDDESIEGYCGISGQRGEVICDGKNKGMTACPFWQGNKIFPPRKKKQIEIELW